MFVSRDKKERNPTLPPSPVTRKQTLLEKAAREAVPSGQCQGFLTLALLTFEADNSLGRTGHRPVHRRIFSSIPGFHLLVVSTIASSRDIQKYLQTLQNVLWGTEQITQLRTTGLEQGCEENIERGQLRYRTFCR